MTNPFAPAEHSLFPETEERNRLKSQFAVALLKNPDDAFKAAVEVFGADTGRALYVAQHWINDEFINSEKVRLLTSHGASAFLPSREDYARAVWKMAEDPKTPSEDRKYLYSLFGDVMGFKKQAEKPGINVNVHQHSVMVMKDHGSDSDWERKAVSQQAALSRGATVIDVESRTAQ